MTFACLPPSNRRHGRSASLIFGLLGLVAALATSPTWAEAPRVTIGSKAFTESVVLGEMAGHLARQAGAVVTHREQLGGTQFVFQALRKGDVDIYPEYLGTLEREVLAGRKAQGEAAVRRELAAMGIRMSRPLGFDNTYVLGMLESRAAELNLHTISDLRQHPGLRLGFSHEFLDRPDGWPGLRRKYDLPQRPRGLNHDLAYRGLEAGDIECMDLYATDAEISYYDLRVLVDDRHFFPSYAAVLLYRDDLADRAPAVVKNLLRLEGQISADTMSALNGRVKIDGESEARVAAEFLNERFDAGLALPTNSWRRQLRRFGQLTGQHLFLVAVSLSVAIVVAIPLGLAAAKLPRLGHGILAVVAVLQTIPSLALLALLIPLLGIGVRPAIVALFLYSLLPIVRNTYAGLMNIPAALMESAITLGLPAPTRVWQIELPMALPSILAGVKTSAVINVGTATLGALIGAGGYGEPILTGIRLNKATLILEGAIPAAVLAILVQTAFELAERHLVSPGLRGR